jgi:hypothetical protein
LTFAKRLNVIAGRDRPRSERYAVRWLARYVDTATAPTIGEAAFIAACLAALGDPRHAEALSALREWRDASQSSSTSLSSTSAGTAIAVAAILTDARPALRSTGSPARERCGVDSVARTTFDRAAGRACVS